MHLMEIERRQFVAGLAVLLGLPAEADVKRKAGRSIIAASTRRRDGSCAAVLYDLDRGLLNAVDLPGRGHDVTVNPTTKECVAFARRPGTFALAFGISRERKPIKFHTPTGRHFYGHGIFSPDGQLLYTTENDFEAERGVIGVWHVGSGYRRVGEFASHGIGPHDVNMLSDHRTLVIANGGIVTHPDHGRRPLNLASMSPSLSYVDRVTGDLLEIVKLPDTMRQRSIRHLDVGENDTVVFGCQFKGARSEVVDLIGFHQRGKSIELLSGGPTVHQALRHYVSSVSVDRSGNYCGVTSSRGQQMVIVDIAARKTVAMHPFRDVSGIAASTQRDGFMITSGDGHVALAEKRGITVARGVPGWSWDNHAISMLLTS